MIATGRILLVWISLRAMKQTVYAFSVTPRIAVPLTRTSKAILSGQSLTPLRYRDSEDEGEELATRIPKGQASAPKEEPTTVDKKAFPPHRAIRPLTVRSLITSQAIVLLITTLTTLASLFLSGHGVDINSIHWNSGTEFFSFWDFNLTPVRMLEGILAATPMIYLGSKLEASDRRDASHVDFSTTNMVMMLFGRRKHEHSVPVNERHPVLSPETSTMQMMLLSIALAVVTGTTEEILFRGVIASAIAYNTHSVMMALFGQALLFGFGHVSAQATPGENKIVAGFQALNALWHGTVYLLAGGDLLPCIVAHALYDTHVFVETWKRTNDQMDYTDKAVLQHLSSDDENEIRRIKQEAGPRLSSETLAFARRFFYAFDYDHQGSLRRSDVQRAISFAFLHDKVQPSEAHVGEMFDRMLQRRDHEGIKVDPGLGDRLRLTEFLRILFLLKAKPHST